MTTKTTTPKFIDLARIVDFPITKSNIAGNCSYRIYKILFVIFLMLIPIGVFAQGVTYYSYQSGNFNNSATWTTDPSGTLSENSAIPGSGDDIVILNGREIYILENNLQVTSVTIESGAVLDLTTTFGHDFGHQLNGKGTLRISTPDFPTFAEGAFVEAGGGTVEYTNMNGFHFGQFTYNNVVINLQNPTDEALFVNSTSAFIVNGDMTINNGLFRINNNTQTSALEVYFNNDIIVNPNGGIGVGNINIGQASSHDSRSHRIFIKGDLINNGGTVRFTNMTAPVYQNEPPGGVQAGWSDVIFDNGSKDQSVVCNGLTVFYRIEIEKGNDQTYVLNIDANDENNFRLFGRNDLQVHNPGDPPNIHNRNALGLLAGTVRLGQNITINSLSTNSYVVDSDAAIWFDGSNVTMRSLTSDGSIRNYGLLKFSSDCNVVFDCRSGITLRLAGSVEIENGTIETTVFRASKYSNLAHRGAFNMSGGTLTVTSFDPNNYTTDQASFTFPYPESVFVMSGGVIDILEPKNLAGSARFFSMILGSSRANSSVTGGTIRINTNSRNAFINSTVPFFNVELYGPGNTFQVRGIDVADAPELSAPQPLIIKGDFTLQNNTHFNNTQNVDLIIGRDFNLPLSSQYTPGNNTTVFNGTRPQSFFNSGTINNGLYNLELSNTSHLIIVEDDIAVLGNLVLESGTTLRDNNFYVAVSGNVYNSGVHYKPSSGGGRIVLNGTNDQFIRGNGTGRFNNLSVNKPSGEVLLNSDITLTSELRLISNTRFNIGRHSLSLDVDADIFSSANGVQKEFSNNKMVLTSGFYSDRGIVKSVSGTGGFLFPYGIQAQGNFYYLPGEINFTATPAKYGKVKSSPVRGRHHLNQGMNNALDAYWKTNVTNFEGIPDNSINLTYTYSPYFISGTENQYVGGVYQNEKTWYAVGTVDDVNKTILFNNIIDPTGEYTAGEISAFEDIPLLFSRQNGDWNESSTWSEVSVGGPQASGIPGENTIVIIGDLGYTHEVIVSNNNIACGALTISEGSTLDIGISTGHHFATIPEATISGQGVLRISGDNYFPNSDFGEFLGRNGGTVEYYTSGSDIIVPFSSDVGAITHYRNLILNHTAGGNITLPQTDLEIFENLTIKGNGGIVQTSYEETYSLNVNGNLNIDSGKLQFMGGQGTVITVIGNLNIAENASFMTGGQPDYPHFVHGDDGGNYYTGDIVIHNGVLYVARQNDSQWGTPGVDEWAWALYDASSANRTLLELHGSLHCNGIFDFSNDNVYASTYFKGVNNAVISGSGTIGFFDLIIDKGINQTPILTLQAPNVTTGTTAQFLTLQNGTFRVDNENVNLILTNADNDFEIPSTSRLSVRNGRVLIAHGASGAGESIVELSGAIEVLGGELLIGNPTLNTNNSIVYAPTGIPKIVVEDGELWINGQIRRSFDNTSGSLKYVQNGGLVTIAGYNQDSRRGKLEILNSGSEFVMGGGLTIIENDGGVDFCDLYLRAEKYSVTGGTIQLGSNNSVALLDFSISASTPLWNLNIGTESRPQILTTEVLPLSVLNDVVIEGSSELKANSNDISIGGSLVNNNSDNSVGLNNGGFRPGTDTQRTTFNGQNSGIQGVEDNVTNFANLVISPSETTVLGNNSNVNVINNLTLKSGVLNNGYSFIRVQGDIENTAKHVSSGQNGGIELNGIHLQTLSGSGGEFGNLILNNELGAKILNNILINGVLSFTEGYLYVDDYMVTLGEYATIGGSPGVNSMLFLNGSLSDQGISKLFAAGNTNAITLPLGVSGKYTPVTYTVHNTDESGKITIKPVNRYHPLRKYAFGDDYLQYYWNVTSSGFQNLSVSHEFTFFGNDAEGDVLSYTGARFNRETHKWEDLGDVVNAAENTISINNVGFIVGEFSAGIPDFKDDIPSFFSRGNGAWEDVNTWSTESHEGSVADSYPDGNVVYIAENHTVFTNNNNAFAYSVQLEGVLDLNDKVFHNFNHVSGRGKIKLNPSPDRQYIFPAGHYKVFFENSSSTVEFAGGNGYAMLPAKPGNVYKPLQNVIFSGNSQKRMPSEHLHVNGSLNIENGAQLSNAAYNKDVYVRKNWMDENSILSGFVPGRGTVYFRGSSEQEVALNYTGDFYNLYINNVEGKQIAVSGEGVNVSNRLSLMNGVLKTAPNKAVTITNNAVNALEGGSSKSYVDGILRKNIINGQSFSFPVGNDGRFGRTILSATSSSTSVGQWGAKYINNNPLDDGFYTDAAENLNSPLVSVSDNEYWMIERPVNGSTNILLQWDSYSYYQYTSNHNLRNFLRVAQYEISSEKWNERGAVVNGSANDGFVSTVHPVSEENFIFTIGANSVPDSYPIANDVARGTSFNTPILLDVMYNDTGLENEPITFSISHPPQLSEGTVVVHPDNTVTFTPAEDYVGVATFKYTIVDDAGLWDDATVTITVHAGENSFPQANNVSVETTRNVPIDIDVLHNDGGLNDEPITVTISEFPHAFEGSVIVNNNNTVTFTPAFDFEGDVVFMYRVTDNDGDYDDATVTVTVLGEGYHTVFFSSLGNGIITASVNGETISSGAILLEGDNVVFTASPQVGYMISNWAVNGEVEVNHFANIYTYSNLNQSINVVVSFYGQPEGTHIINFGVDGGNGELFASLNGAQIFNGSAVNIGSSIEFNAVPTSGYMVNEWKVDNEVQENLKARDFVYTIDTPSLVTVSFNEQPEGTYIVNFGVDGENGSISANVEGTQIYNGSAVASGAVVNFVAIPESGYMVESWTVNGALQSNQIANSFSQTIAGNTEVLVAFHTQPEGTCIVNFGVDGENGSITASVEGTQIYNGSAVASGAVVNFVAIPESGYMVESWTVNGALQSTQIANNFSHTITGNTEVLVAFHTQLEGTYIVNFGVDGENGSISAYVNGTQIYNGSAVADGAVVNFVAAPETSYMVESWTVNGTLQSNQIANSFYHTVTENISVLVSFNTQPEGTYIVNFGVDGGSGSITAFVNNMQIYNGAAVAEGDVVEFLAEPIDGSMIEGWRMNGEVIPFYREPEYPHTVEDNVRIGVFFRVQSDDSHIVTFYVEGGNGNISATDNSFPIVSGDLVDSGGEVVFRASPDQGFMVQQWTVNGIQQDNVVASVLRYTVNENIHVTVSYHEQPEGTYIVSFDVEGENGTVSASVDGVSITSGAAVEEGKQVDFVALPDVGYMVNSWKLNNIILENIISRNYSKTVTEDIDLLVSFQNQPEGTYIVGFGVEGDNGSITAFVDGAEIYNGSAVADGAVVNFVAEPESGYMVEAWRVNGTLQANQIANSFNHTVTEDVEVLVVFHTQPEGTYIVNFGVEGDNGSITAFVDGTQIFNGSAVLEGKTVDFNAAPQFAFMVDKWTVNGLLQENQIANNFYYEVDRDLTVLVSFRVLPEGAYVVNFGVKEGKGSIAATANDVSIINGTAVEKGATLIFKAKPADGYVLKLWEKNGDLKTIDSGNNTLVIPELSGCLIVYVFYAEIPVREIETSEIYIELERNNSVIIDVLENVEGFEEGDEVIIGTNPLNGFVTINPDNTVTYTPTHDFYGIDEFTYGVCTPHGHCSFSSVYLVIMLEDFRIPEGFSPNGDGLNDTFEIRGIEIYSQIKIRIYNRWGNLVFKSDNYQNNWAGRSNTTMSLGKTLPNDTYYYVIEVVDIGKSITGNVFLKR